MYNSFAYDKQNYFSETLPREKNIAESDTCHYAEDCKLFQTEWLKNRNGCVPKLRIVWSLCRITCAILVGVLSDVETRKKTHVTLLCRSVNFPLGNIARTRHYRTPEVTGQGVCLCPQLTLRVKCSIVPSMASITIVMSVNVLKGRDPSLGSSYSCFEHSTGHGHASPTQCVSRHMQIRSFRRSEQS